MKSKFLDNVAETVGNTSISMKRAGKDFRNSTFMDTLRTGFNYTVKLGFVAALGLAAYAGYNRYNQDASNEAKSAALAFQESEQRVIATVVGKSEYVLVAPFVSAKDHSSFAGPFTLDGRLTLKCKRADNGDAFNLSVISGLNASPRDVSYAVKDGTVISFPQGNLVNADVSMPRYNETYFTPKTTEGTKTAGRIGVLYPSNQKLVF